MTDQSLIIVFQYYNDHCDDVNPDFPHETLAGASSAIVLGGTFEVFTEVAGGGESSTLTEREYPTPEAMKVVTYKIRSVRKTHWTSSSSSDRLDDLFAQA